MRFVHSIPSAGHADHRSVKQAGKELMDVKKCFIYAHNMSFYVDSNFSCVYNNGRYLKWIDAVSGIY